MVSNTELETKCLRASSERPTSSFKPMQCPWHIIPGPILLFYILEFRIYTLIKGSLGISSVG